MPHPSDTLALSYNDDADIFLHRKDPQNFEITLSTFELKKFEAFVLLESLLDHPLYQERAIELLTAKELVRSNHLIP